MPYRILLFNRHSCCTHSVSSWNLLSSGRVIDSISMPCWLLLPQHSCICCHNLSYWILLPKDQPHSASPLPSWYLFLQYQHHSLHILCSRHVLRRCGRLLSMHFLLSTGTAELCQRPDYPGVHDHVRRQVCPLYKQDCQRQPHPCVHLDLPFGLLLQEQLRSLPGLQG